MWLQCLKLLLLVLVSLVAYTAAKGYEGYKVYNVTPQSEVQVLLLKQLATESSTSANFDFFTLSHAPGQQARVLVPPAMQTDFLELLKEHAVPFAVSVDDVGGSLQKEWQQQHLLRLIRPYAGTGRLGTERYYTHDEINAYLDDLAQRFPTRVFVKTVGKTYEQRLMKTITITNGDGRAGKNVIFMDGGFHAREWISPAAVVYAIGELVENYSANAGLLLDYDWVILPVVNADGYEYSQLSSDTRLWRKTRQPLDVGGVTCIGTDPNRNFGFHWNENGASPDPCAPTYAGPRAFSEPEAVVVRDIMFSLRGRGIMYLTVHSYGKYLLYPWGWSSDLPDTWEDLHEVAQAGADAIYAHSGTIYTVGSSTNVLYVAAGASDDFAFNDGFPISFTMELPGGGPNGFDPPPSSIDSIVKETWAGIRTMAEKVNVKYPTLRSEFL